MKIFGFVDLNFYTGYVTGQSKEIVYSETTDFEEYTRSQLDWKINNLWILGANVVTDLVNNTVHILFDGWVKASESRATMQNRDWVNRAQPNTVTHISWSPSKLKQAYELTLEFGGDLFHFDVRKQQFKFIALTGFEYLNLCWNSRGGSYLYANESPGDFDQKLGISYEQRFSIPYGGLKIEWKISDSLNLNAFGKLSSSARVWTYDFHAFRSVKFTENFRYADYWTAGGVARWKIWNNLDVDLKYEYEQLNTAKGSMEVKPPDEPARFYPLSAGTYHNHQTLALGFFARF